MDTHRGATLATATTLGLADTSDLGPTAGNGFYRRWPDDLALFQSHGVTDLRLTLDWARLQPRPGVVEGSWVDQYEQILAAAEAIGLRVWATMFDGDVPRWFDNEGGVADDEALTTWWPRFVERAAERFGHLVAGWIPFAVIPDGAPDQPWRDTWGILHGDSPVVAAVSSADTARPARLVGSTDLIGVDLEVGLPADSDPSDSQLAELAERWAESIATASHDVGVPATVGLTPRHDNPDVSGRLVDGLVAAVGWAAADGVEVTTCFVDPGIAGPDHPWGLFDTDRAPLPALAALTER